MQGRARAIRYVHDGPTRNLSGPFVPDIFPVRSHPSGWTMMRFSANIRELEESATLAVAALARKMKEQGREVIDLSIGEPDFRTPDFAAQAGIASIVQGFTHYTPVPGLPTLRQLIAEHLQRLHDRDTESAGVVVTAGAKHALFNACFTLFGPDDRVLLPAPYWTSYPELIKLARATPVIIPTQLEDGFKVTPETLAAHYDGNVRGLILNSATRPAPCIRSPSWRPWCAGRTSTTSG